MKKSLVALAIGSLFGVAARAEDPPAAPAVATNVSLTTNYKFRGQDQGNNKPAFQGGFDYANSGFYVGNWNSTIGFTNTGIEMDFYGGYKGEIVKDLGFDVGVYQYYYPQKDKSVSFDTTELYVAVSYSFLSLKYSGTVSSDYFGYGESAQLASQQTETPLASKPNGRGTGYLDLSANYEVAKGLTLNGHVGYTRYSSDLRNVYADSLPSYTDYKLGATYDLGQGFSVAGAVVGATKRDAYKPINDNRFIVTLTKTM